MTFVQPSASPALPQSGGTPSLRQLCLLSLAADFLLDASRHRSLEQALLGSEPLDVLRMLAQQWDTGLTTLSGDIRHVHAEYVKPGVAGRFIEGVRAALYAEADLRQVGQGRLHPYNEMLRYMAKNQPFHAAWCAALCWERPRSMN